MTQREASLTGLAFRTMNLDGTWDFVHSMREDDHRSSATSRSIVVPGPWQAQFEDLRMRGGIGTYRRAIDLSEDWRPHAKYLRIGASFHSTYVYVNGEFVGRNEGGFLPFSFDVTDFLKVGTNEITIKVESPTDDVEAYPDAPLAEIPFGKQSWYGPLSGIWQSVCLEQRIRDHISRIRIRASLKDRRARARIIFAHPLEELSILELVVLGPASMPVLRSTNPIEGRQSEYEAVFQFDDIEAWSPDSPHLYTLEATVKRGNLPVDRVSQTFGFRTIETRDGKIYLNDELLYLRGALDQDYYPEMICTPPSLEFLEDQFRKAKELGLNCLRCHIKAPDPRYYDVADRVGILIWTELPNGGISTDRSRARKEATLKGIVDRDCHHPSIIIWTIINENWGVDLVHDGEHRDWLKRTYRWLKSYDPERLVVDNSPLFPSFHVATDIADYHFYAGFPDNRMAWDDFVGDLESRPPWLFSPGGDSVETGTEPLLCSEFGNWGLPQPAQLRDRSGEEPWWFETGHDWGEGIMYPHGIENRFQDWSLDRVFGDLEGFVKAAQGQQFRALKYEIEAMRRRRGIAGYVITAFTDTHWECNGLLDMCRNRRAFHDAFHTINADVVVVPRWTRLSYFGGETAELGIAVANGGKHSLENAGLAWDGGSGRHVRTLAPIPSGSVCDAGNISVPFPYVTQAEHRRVHFELLDANGERLARNFVECAIYPVRRSPERGTGLLYSPDVDFRDRLRKRGYRLAESPATASLIVARKHDAEIAALVRTGHRLLLLPESEIALDPFFPHWQSVKVRRREDTLWSGNWASSFAWLRRTGRFRAIPDGPLLDETLDAVLPDHVIVGCNLMDFQSRVHAGLVVGWIHKPVALVVERPYGKGRILISTLRAVREGYEDDPAALTLLDLLIAQALGIDGAGIRGAVLVSAE